MKYSMPKKKPWVPKKNPSRYLNTHSIKRELRKIHSLEGEKKKLDKLLMLTTPRPAGCVECIWFSGLIGKGSPYWVVIESPKQ